MLHFAWPWFSPETVHAICIACPVMSCYARLRSEALALSNAAIISILQPLDFSLPAPVLLSMHRARDISKLLLLCDFEFGHFQRFMGRIYTGDFLDFDAMDDTVSAL